MNAAAKGSLRRRASILIIVSGVVVAVMATGALIAFRDLSRARERLVDRLDPALVESGELLAALVDQETGVRGFVLSGQDSFLLPWNTGRQNEQTITAALVALFDSEQSAKAALSSVTQASDQWRSQAATALSESSPGTVTDQQLQQSKVLFDTVRTRHEALNKIVVDSREVARMKLNGAADWLRAWLLALIVVMILLLIGVAVELRRSVLRPLSLTVDQTKLVAGGDLDHHISVDGPSEFVQLGEVTESMRQTIVDQLREVDRSRAELAASNSELEQFAYVASHDLQEPLRKVAAFSQLLQQRYAGQLDERADTYIRFAVDGAKRMQELINDLLAFSRVGRSNERMALISLDDVISRAIANVSESIESSGATIETDPLPIVNGDRTLLVGLFQNLISNAVKFRDPSRTPIVKIHVRGGATEPFEFDVVDNGIGIEPEYAERVFVVFQRLHTREDYEGTGIGLAMCRKIVDYHGGRMWITDDHEGDGTTIRFTLPDPAMETTSDGDPTPTHSPQLTQTGVPAP